MEGMDVSPVDICSGSPHRTLQRSKSARPPMRELEFVSLESEV